MALVKFCFNKTLPPFLSSTTFLSTMTTGTFLTCLTWPINSGNNTILTTTPQRFLFVPAPNLFPALSCVKLPDLPAISRATTNPLPLATFKPGFQPSPHLLTTMLSQATHHQPAILSNNQPLPNGHFWARITTIAMSWSHFLSLWWVASPTSTHSCL